VNLQIFSFFPEITGGPGGNAALTKSKLGMIGLKVQARLSTTETSCVLEVTDKTSFSFTPEYKNPYPKQGSKMYNLI